MSAGIAAAIAGISAIVLLVIWGISTAASDDDPEEGAVRALQFVVAILALAAVVAFCVEVFVPGPTYVPIPYHAPAEHP